MPNHAGYTAPPRGKSDPDRIVELARRQLGLVTRSQLSDAGLSPRTIHGWRENQRLLPAGRSVFALGRRVEGLRASCMAASMIVGDESAVSGMAAARLWGIERKYSGDITVAFPRRRRPPQFRLDSRGVWKPRQVKVRRNRNLTPAMVTRQFGIPLMRPSWLLLELAGVVSPEMFERLFKEADRLNILLEAELRECANCGSGFPGIELFRTLLARRHPDTKDARTLLEILFLEICAEYGIETPQVNHPQGRYYPDFRWRDIKLIVEVDGYEGHAGGLAFLDDAARENDLRTLGYQVIRFTWEEVTEQPGKVAALVIQEITRCRALAGLI